VLQAALRVVRAGDGLSESMTISPVEYHVGEDVTIVLKGTIKRVSYEPIKDTDALRRVHTLSASFGMVIDEQLVHGVLEKQRQRIEEAKGVQRLEFDVDEDEDEGED
jgi:hypothetical protein